MLIAFAALPFVSSANVYDITANWSDVNNPNGVWSFVQGNTLLPHVDWWQRNAGGWTVAQPGFADSEDGNDRLPFYFKSNGSETFARDFVMGDIVTHCWDAVNGSGNTYGSARFTAPYPARVDISGANWMGRDIGRSADWYLSARGVVVSTGSLASGDAYSRAFPMDYALGSGGSAALTGHLLDTGDAIDLKHTNTSTAGDFIGITMKLTETKLFTRTAPSNTTVRLGKIASGNNASLAATDGDVLRVCKFIVPNQSVAPINVEVTGTSAVANPSELVFRTRIRAAHNGQLQLKLDMYDYSIANFGATDTSTTLLNTAFAEQEAVGTGSLARYIGPGNEVKARFRVTATGPVSVQLWCIEADKAVWLIAQ
ncbi:MAG: hypothetical protein JSS66_03325 [Armatimonadetes bacterium]|nr:hypothetical protein [Armatimonadota bacterium]